MKRMLEAMKQHLLKLGQTSDFFTVIPAKHSDRGTVMARVEAEACVDVFGAARGVDVETSMRQVGRYGRVRHAEVDRLERDTGMGQVGRYGPVRHAEVDRLERDIAVGHLLDMADVMQEQGIVERQCKG